jgi:hypothetical protein
MGEDRNIYRVLIMKLQGKRKLGRPTYVRQTNVKMHLKKLDGGGVEWIDVSQDKISFGAVVNAVMNLRIPYNSGDLLTL